MIEFLNKQIQLLRTSALTPITGLKDTFQHSGALEKIDIARQILAAREYANLEARYFNTDGTPKAGTMLAPNDKPSKCLF